MPWGDGAWTREPWLPLHAPTTVAAQRDDPGSTLHLVRDLIALRRALRRRALRDAARAGGRLGLPPRRHAIALNLGAAPATIDRVQGDARHLDATEGDVRWRSCRATRR